MEGTYHGRSIGIKCFTWFSVTVANFIPAFGRFSVDSYLDYRARAPGHTPKLAACLSVCHAEKEGTCPKKARCSGPSGLIPEIKNAFNT